MPIAVSRIVSPTISEATRRCESPLVRIDANSAVRSDTLTEMMLKISANAIAPPKANIIPTNTATEPVMGLAVPAVGQVAQQRQDLDAGLGVERGRAARCPLQHQELAAWDLEGDVASARTTVSPWPYVLVNPVARTAIRSSIDPLSTWPP